MTKRTSTKFRKHVERILKHLYNVGDDLPICGVEPSIKPVPLTDFDITVTNDLSDLDAPIPAWCSPSERAETYRAIFLMREGYVYLDWQTVLPADVTYSIEMHNN